MTSFRMSIVMADSSSLDGQGPVISFGSREPERTVEEDA